MRTAMIILLALSVTAPALTQNAPCPSRIEPVSLEGILFCDNRYETRSSLLLYPLTNYTSGYNTAAEFSTPDMMRDIQQVTLVVEVINEDPGGTIGQIVLYNYIGDGIVTASEFWAGSFYSVATMNEDGYWVPVVFDVTSAALNAFEAEEPFIGFRLRAYNDHYSVNCVYLCVDDGTPIEAVSWGKVKRIYR